MATDAPGRNVACVRRGDGYAQFGGMPFIMDSVHHIEKSEYERRVTTKWPAANDNTIVATMPELPQTTAATRPNILSDNSSTAPPEEHNRPADASADHASPAEVDDSTTGP